MHKDDVITPGDIALDVGLLGFEVNLAGRYE